jgi:hypothetical protein
LKEEITSFKTLKWKPKRTYGIEGGRGLYFKGLCEGLLRIRIERLGIESFSWKAKAAYP